MEVYESAKSMISPEIITQKFCNLAKIKKLPFSEKF